MKPLRNNRVWAVITVLVCGLVASYGAKRRSLEIHAGGDFAFGNSITGIGTLADPVVISGSMTGEGGVLEIFNLNRYGNFALTSHEDAIWVRMELVNGTTEVWDNFDFELQTVLGQPSTNPDGLSFGQGYRLADRPWNSPNYGAFEEFDQDRDFINFTGGLVMPGQTAIMSYVISHNGRANTVQLLMRPNFSPIAPPPIPEPSTLVLGSMAALGLFSMRRRLK